MKILYPFRVNIAKITFRRKYLPHKLYIGGISYQVRPYQPPPRQYKKNVGVSVTLQSTVAPLLDALYVANLVMTVQVTLHSCVLMPIVEAHIMYLIGIYLPTNLSLRCQFFVTNSTGNQARSTLSSLS